MSLVFRVIVAVVLMFSPAVMATESAPEMVQGATTVNSAEAKRLYDDGVAFVDPRGDADFAAGRVPEAMQLFIKGPDFTSDNLEQLVARGEPVVFYCNGPKCKLSSAASTKAIEWGWTQVYYFREGFPGWTSAGYPVE